MKKIAAFILFIGVLDSISAQSTLTLDSCRALALSNNKELRISAEKITAAHYEKKAAFTNYLPKIAAIGTYMRTQKEISLLSDEQKGVISQIGTTAQGSIQETFQQLAASNPELAQILQPLAPLIPGIGNALNKVGQGLVDALRTDTRNMYAGAVTLTQPIFMGGKIVAYNKITPIRRTAGRITARHRYAGYHFEYRPSLLASHLTDKQEKTSPKLSATGQPTGQ